MVPYVIEVDDKGNDKAYDLYSRLLKDRIVFIGKAFNDDLANSVVAQLLFLQSMSKDDDIYLYVNSPGGSISSMLAIYDTMQYIKPDIVTIGLGRIASAGSLILAAGTKGKRKCLPNAEIMIHELSSGTEGKAGHIFNEVEHLKKMHNKLANMYTVLTGQPVKKLKKDMEKDCWMTAEEAKSYGLIDEII